MRSAWDSRIATKGMTIGERLAVTSDEVVAMLRNLKRGDFALTITEDLSTRLTKGRI